MVSIACFSAGQLVPALAAHGCVGQDGRDRAAVFALQPVQQCQPFLDLVQPPGRRLDALGVAMQLVQQVLGLERQRTRARRQPVQLRVHPTGRLERLCPGRESERGAPFVAAVQRAGAAVGRRPQRLDVAQAAALGLELALLLLAGRRPVDLRELPLEQVQLTIACTGPIAQLLQPGRQRAFAAIRPAVGLAARRLVRPREAVQDLQLGRGQHQLAMLVLAVEREQRGARVPQIARGGAPAADVRTRSPLRVHPPRQHKVLSVLRQTVPECLAHRVRQREHPLDVGLRSARADDAGPWFAAEQQIQRMRQHRLAGPGLPCEHVQPWPETQLGPLDQQEVLDAQFVEHAEGSTSGGRRIGPESPGTTHIWHRFSAVL